MADPGQAQPAGPPSLVEARGWIGFELDEMDGTRVGRVHAVFSDADGRGPAWLIASLERRGVLRRRTVAQVAVPIRDCAGAAGRVWTAHRREELRGAPTVDPRRPLLREHELTICAHYGIGERVGRAAEVVGRPAGAVTSQPAMG
jgi:hypothetical protein